MPRREIDIRHSTDRTGVQFKKRLPPPSNNVIGRRNLLLSSAVSKYDRFNEPSDGQGVTKSGADSGFTRVSLSLTAKSGARRSGNDRREGGGIKGSDSGSSFGSSSSSPRSRSSIMELGGVKTDTNGQKKKGGQQEELGVSELGTDFSHLATRWTLLLFARCNCIQGGKKVSVAPKKGSLSPPGPTASRRRPEEWTLVMGSHAHLRRRRCCLHRSSQLGKYPRGMESLSKAKLPSRQNSPHWSNFLDCHCRRHSFTTSEMGLRTRGAKCASLGVSSH